jgi:hypothetical protein
VTTVTVSLEAAMKPFSKTREGKAVDTLATELGSSTSQLNKVISRKSLEVIGENTKGNFKDPNNFYFRLVDTSGGFDNRYSYGYEPVGGKYWRRYVSDDPGPQPNQTGNFTIPSDWSGIKDTALEKVFNKLRGDPNLVVDVLEGKKTLQMVRNALNVRKTLKDFLRNTVLSPPYKRIKGPSQGQRRLDYVTSKWLEYRYGWMPLIYSTYDLLEEVHRTQFGGYTLVTGRSGRSCHIVEVDTYGVYPTVKRTTTTDRKDRYHLAMNFQRKDSKSIYDWTSLNPASIAWELIPLSFVGDWFMNIGQTLELWENHIIYSGQFRSGYETYTVKEERVATAYGAYASYPPLPTTPGDWASVISQKGKTVVKILDRRVLTGLPRPAGFRVRTELNSKRLLDAASLIQQLVGKRTR